MLEDGIIIEIEVKSKSEKQREDFSSWYHKGLARSFTVRDHSTYLYVHLAHVSLIYPKNKKTCDVVLSL